MKQDNRLAFAVLLFAGIGVVGAAMAIGLTHNERSR